MYHNFFKKYYQQFKKLENFRKHNLEKLSLHQNSMEDIENEKKYLVKLIYKAESVYYSLSEKIDQLGFDFKGTNTCIQINIEHIMFY